MNSPYLDVLESLRGGGSGRSRKRRSIATNGVQESIRSSGFAKEREEQKVSFLRKQIAYRFFFFF